MLSRLCMVLVHGQSCNEGPHKSSELLCCVKGESQSVGQDLDQSTDWFCCGFYYVSKGCYRLLHWCNDNFAVQFVRIIPAVAVYTFPHARQTPILSSGSLNSLCVCGYYWHSLSLGFENCPNWHWKIIVGTQSHLSVKGIGKTYLQNLFLQVSRFATRFRCHVNIEKEPQLRNCSKCLKTGIVTKTPFIFYFF